MSSQMDGGAGAFPSFRLVPRRFKRGHSTNLSTSSTATSSSQASTSTASSSILTYQGRDSEEHDPPYLASPLQLDTRRFGAPLDFSRRRDGDEDDFSDPNSRTPRPRSGMSGKGKGREVEVVDGYHARTAHDEDWSTTPPPINSQLGHTSSSHLSRWSHDSTSQTGLDVVLDNSPTIPQLWPSRNMVLPSQPSQFAPKTRDSIFFPRPPQSPAEIASTAGRDFEVRMQFLDSASPSTSSPNVQLHASASSSSLNSASSSSRSKTSRNKDKSPPVIPTRGSSKRQSAFPATTLANDTTIHLPRLPPARASSLRPSTSASTNRPSSIDAVLATVTPVGTSSRIARLQESSDRNRAIKSLSLDLPQPSVIPTAWPIGRTRSVPGYPSGRISPALSTPQLHLQLHSRPHLASRRSRASSKSSIAISLLDTVSEIPSDLDLSPTGSWTLRTDQPVNRLARVKSDPGLRTYTSTRSQGVSMPFKFKLKRSESVSNIKPRSAKAESALDLSTLRISDQTSTRPTPPPSASNKFLSIKTARKNENRNSWLGIPDSWRPVASDKSSSGSGSSASSSKGDKLSSRSESALPTASLQPVSIDGIASSNASFMSAVTGPDDEPQLEQGSGGSSRDEVMAESVEIGDVDDRSSMTPAWSPSASSDWLESTLGDIEEAQLAVAEAVSWTWPLPPTTLPYLPGQLPTLSSAASGMSSSQSASTLGGPVTPPSQGGLLPPITGLDNLNKVVASSSSISASGKRLLMSLTDSDEEMYGRTSPTLGVKGYDGRRKGPIDMSERRMTTIDDERKDVLHGELEYGTYVGRNKKARRSLHPSAMMEKKGSEYLAPAWKEGQAI